MPDGTSGYPLARGYVGVRRQERPVPRSSGPRPRLLRPHPQFQTFIVNRGPEQDRTAEVLFPDTGALHRWLFGCSRSPVAGSSVDIHLLELSECLRLGTSGRSYCTYDVRQGVPVTEVQNSDLPPYVLVLLCKRGFFLEMLGKFSSPKPCVLKI